jgi:hypothetical protein
VASGGAQTIACRQPSRPHVVLTVAKSMLKSIPSSLALEILMVSPSLITKKVLDVYLKVHLPMETSTDHLAYEVVLGKFPVKRNRGGGGAGS